MTSVPVLVAHDETVLVSAAGEAELEAAYEIASDINVRDRWLLRGMQGGVSFAQFSQWLAHQGAIHALVLDIRRPHAPGAHVVCYELDMQNRVASVGLASGSESRRSRLAFRGFVLFLDYCFSNFDLRKVYGEVIDYNYQSFRSGATKYFDVEGVLRSHEYRYGQHWNVNVLAMYPHHVDRMMRGLRLRSLRNSVVTYPQDPG